MRTAFLTSNGAVRRMAAAGLISAVGDRLQQVAMATLIFSSTGSVLQAGLVFVVSTVPYALFGPRQAASNGMAAYLSESVGVPPLFIALGGAMALTGAVALAVPSAREAP